MRAQDLKEPAQDLKEPALPEKIEVAATSKPAARMLIYTIGHSTRTTSEVIEMLQKNGVKQLIDVRSYPTSARNPQWNREQLEATFAAESGGIVYQWLQELGGRRKPLPRAQSINGWWENESFRGYADYMQTTEFAEGLVALLELAAAMPTAIMCSEAVWWRCHRSMVADALIVAGAEVVHIMSKTTKQKHTLRDSVRIVAETGCLSYPAEVAPSALAVLAAPNARHAPKAEKKLQPA